MCTINSHISSYHPWMWTILIILDMWDGMIIESYKLDSILITLNALNISHTSLNSIIVYIRIWKWTWWVIIYFFCARGKEKAKIAPIARHVKDQLDIIAPTFFTAQADIETFNTPPKQEKIRHHWCKKLWQRKTIQIMRWIEFCCEKSIHARLEQIKEINQCKKFM